MILDDINDLRLQENLVHLVPTAELNQLAENHLNDLLARSINALGDVFVTTAGQDISDQLRQVDYTPYTNGYIADIVPGIVRQIAPDGFVDFWIEDARQTNPTVTSLRIQQGSERFLPIFSAKYREIGIAYRYNANVERHYYVLVFAARPNVLPIVPVELDRERLNVIAQVVPNAEIAVFLHNERNDRFGAGGNIGEIEWIQISEQPFGEVTCPNQTGEGWERYRSELVYTLSDGSGIKTLNVAMCDLNGRSIVMTTQVEFIGSSGGGDGVFAPDVLGIANVTQTAAASATAYAPFEPTVEAILTATAAALSQ